MDLYIHIGTEKTGTTATQNWFSQNRKALQQQKVFYPKSWGDPNCRRIAVAARDVDKPDDGFVANRLTTPEAHKQFVLNCKSGFEKERDAAALQGARAMVVSGEHMHSRLSSERMVARVPGLFGDSFARKFVVIHLRPQIDVAVSSISTAAKAGIKVGRERLERISADQHYYSYDAMVKMWENVFGVENVILVPFRRKPSLIDWFIQRLKLDKQALTKPERTNEALGVKALALANAARMSGITKERTVNRHRNFFIDDLPQGEKLSIGLGLAKRLHRRFEDDNRTLAERRPDINQQDLRPDWNRYDAPSNIEQIEVEPVFREPLQTMITRFNAEIFLERGISQIYLARYHLNDGDDAKARAAIANSRRLLTLACADEHVKEQAEAQLEECERHRILIEARLKRQR